MSRRFGPYRRLRSEILPLTVVLAVPIVLWMVFPGESLFMSPSAPPAPAVASCAFVTLTPQAERRALAAARTAWQADRRPADALRIDLVAASLPPLRPAPVLNDMSTLRAGRVRNAVRRVPDLLPASLAAEPPATIPAEGETDDFAMAFPREELLNVRW